MGDPLTWGTIGTLGLGAYNSFFNKPDTPQQIMPNYSSPNTVSYYDQPTNTQMSLANYTPQQYGQQALYDLYSNRIMGGQSFADWQGSTKDQMADLLGKITAHEQYRGIMELDPSKYETWAPEKKEALEYYLKDDPAIREYWEQYQALNDMLGTQKDIPFSQVGTSTPERQQQIGEQTGTYQELLERAAQESYTSALADLARRGVTGGTAETDLAQRQAETEVNVQAQTNAFANELQRYDDEQKRWLLSYIAGAQNAGEAQGLQSAALQQSGQYGAQQLAMAQQQWQAQQAQMRQQSMNNMMQLLGTGMSGYQTNQNQQSLLDLLNRYAWGGQQTSGPVGYIPWVG